MSVLTLTVPWLTVAPTVAVWLPPLSTQPGLVTLAV